MATPSRKDSRLNGLNPLSYIGANPYSPPNLISDNRPPTSNDRKNFDIGSIWIDRSPVAPSSPDVWMLVRIVTNTATWIKLAEGESSAETFPTDLGTAVPAAGVLNIVGDGDNISTAGAGNTVTISLSDDVADVFQTDIDFAIPVAGSLEIAGGTSITTVGAGDVVTIHVDSDVATSYKGDSGTATPAANVITIAGGSNVTTNAAGSTVTITASGGGGGAANASFLAHQAADGGDPSATASGVKLGAAVVMTEVYDIGANFTVGDGAGVAAKFTCPQDGKYLLQAKIVFDKPVAAYNAIVNRYIEIQTSNRTYRETDNRQITGGVWQTSYVGLSISVVADMDSGDIAEYFAWDVWAGLGVVFIQGDVSGTGEYQTFVSGTLVDTDTTSFTEHAVLVGDATGDIGELNLATDGQVLIGATGAASDWANITAGANITINEGANTLEIISTGGGLGSSVASFLVYQATDDPLIGNIRPANLGETTVLTEVYDLGNDFYIGDGAGTAATFTAPQDGKYQLNYAVDTVFANSWIETTKRIYYSKNVEPGTGNASSIKNIVVVADMDNGDTATFGYLRGFSGASGVVSGFVNPALTFLNGAYQTYISGTLV